MFDIFIGGARLKKVGNRCINSSYTQLASSYMLVTNDNIYGTMGFKTFLVKMEIYIN